jgi:hypothetical protein
MTNRSKSKGTAAETAVVDYLRARGFPYAERRAMRGNNDQGDISGLPGVVIEVKACREMALAEWVDEAETERCNAGADLAVVWHKRRGRSSAGGWYVTMTGEALAGLLQCYGVVVPAMRARDAVRMDDGTP